MRKEIRYCGSGGQGIILLGIVTANAACISGNYSSQGAVYGAAVRGGITSSEVVLSKEPIIFPYIERSDILLALSDEAFKYYLSGAKKGSIIITDSNLVKIPDEIRNEFEIYEQPFTRISIEKFNTHTLANMIAFGFVSRFLKDLFDENAAVKSIEENVSAKFRDIDIHAYRIGKELT